MKRIFAGLLLILLTKSADAETIAQWRSATVKVSSFPCAGERPRFSGSGLLIAARGGLWVITSEHVVLNGRAPQICHQVTGIDGSSPATLVVSDYKMGLALLKIEAPPSAHAVAFTDGGVASLTNSTLSAFGYPAASSAIQVLENGHLLTTESRRALIPGVRALIESAGLPVEYGMSGGPLVAVGADGRTELIGFLSHQVLRREAGSTTVSRDINADSGGDANDLAIAIPVAEAKRWFLNQFINQDGPVWQRLASAQIAGTEVIRYGALLFSSKSESAAAVWQIGGADGTGIGGADGSGIGGADGTGIGGREAARRGSSDFDSETLLVVNVALDPQASALLRATPFADPRIDQWRRWLLTDKTVKIGFLVKRDDDRLAKISSLAGFFTSWLRDAQEPLALRSRDGQQSADVSRLIDLARDATVLAQRLIDQCLGDDSQRAWLAGIRDLSLKAETGFTRSQVIAALLGGKNLDRWNEFYQNDFDSAVELESALQNLIRQMEKMGL